MEEDGNSGNAERSICVTDSALGGGNGDANDGLEARDGQPSGWDVVSSGGAAGSSALRASAVATEAARSTTAEK